MNSVWKKVDSNCLTRLKLKKMLEYLIRKLCDSLYKFATFVESTFQLDYANPAGAVPSPQHPYKVPMDHYMQIRDTVANEIRVTDKDRLTLSRSGRISESLSRELTSVWPLCNRALPLSARLIGWYTTSLKLFTII